MKVRLCREAGEPGVTHLWQPEPVKNLNGLIVAYTYRCARCWARGYGHG